MSASWSSIWSRIFTVFLKRVGGRFAPAHTLGCGRPLEPTGAGCGRSNSTPLHASPTPSPPGSVPTHPDTVGSAPPGTIGQCTPVHPDSNEDASVEIANGGCQDLEPTTPSRVHSLPILTHVHSTQFSLPLDQPSQSLQTRVTEHSTATVSALSQLPVVTSRVQVPLATRLDLPRWQVDRLLPQQRDTRDLDGATP